MKVLVYDGDCSICRAASRLLVRPCLTGRGVRRPLDAFDGDTAERLVEAEIHNEMAVLDRESGEIRSGFQGILWLLRDGALRGPALLLGIPGVRHVLTFLYHLIAYNRRVLAPVPAQTVACACDPDPHALYQWSFNLLCAVFAAAWVLIGSTPLVVAWTAAGILLAVYGATFVRAPGAPSRTVLVGHLAWIFAVSSLPLYASALVAWSLHGAGAAPVMVVGALLAVGVMNLMLGRRADLLRLTLPSFLIALYLWGLVVTLLYLTVIRPATM